MPYGLRGGDTPEKDAKMERCVAKLTGRYGKVSAIKICKVQIQGDAKGRPKTRG